MATITIPYKPRYPMADIHKQLESHRFNVLVAHRRMGKSVGAINHKIKMALKNDLWQPHYAYIAPFRNQAKLIIWEYLKHYIKNIPKVKINESELMVEFLGRRVYLFGADNPDSIRGSYWDGVILDEYAQIKPEIWTQAILPALSDRKGWALFLGTPKGQNHFYDIYESATRMMNDGDPNWWAGIYRADETGVVALEELELLRKTMSDNEFRQEYLCDFTASADNVLITIDLVTTAAHKILREENIIGMPKIIGVDVARYGGDKAVIFRRQGLQAFTPKVFDGIDNMSLAAQVAYEIDDWKADAVFIDAGRGEGVIDRLRQMNYVVFGIDFGGTKNLLKPMAYYNKRAEMWTMMRDWLESGGSIPNMPDLKADLISPMYKHDEHNKIKLESKEDIKTRLKRSPDLADALALTFAMPVAASGDMRFNSRRLHFAATNYNPIGSSGKNQQFADASYNPFKRR